MGKPAVVEREDDDGVRNVGKDNYHRDFSRVSRRDEK